jgi:hypothetical protein
MALCTSGEISLGGSTTGRSINCELGYSGTAQISLNDAGVRGLVSIGSGQISMNCFYGASSFDPSYYDQVCGGWYVGDIQIASGSCYYLIVAPNATGCNSGCQWKTTCSYTCCDDQRCDGYCNTYCKLNNASHPAARWTATRTIGGFSDWYLPAVAELQSANRRSDNCFQPGLCEAFSPTSNTGCVYWSSTEPNYGANCKYATTALMCCAFETAPAGLSLKTAFEKTRAMRRVPK